MKEVLDGRYEVLEKIKEGGMGNIYKSRYLPRNEIRVVKTMKSSGEPDRRTMNRFEREARLCTSLRHPNIATVHEFFQMADGNYAMAMEYIDGFNLSEYARSKKEFPVTEVVEIGTQTLDALAYLHSKGIIHRDISPENIMLEKVRDGHHRVKLIDLGVAKELKEEGLTETGMFVGKIRYSSPEQLGILKRGERIDGRSDIYSVGIVLYQFLTNELPVFADSMQGYILGHVRTPARPFEETDPDGKVPISVRAVVMKALEKRREDRWTTAEEFGTTLQRILDDLIAKRPTANQERDENGRLWAPANEPVQETKARIQQQEPPEDEEDNPYDAPTSTQGLDLPGDGDMTSAGTPAGSSAPKPGQPDSLPSLSKPEGKKSAGSKNVIFLAISAAAVILAVVLVIFGLRARKGPSPDAVPLPAFPDGTVVFTASPWAEIVSIEDADNKKTAAALMPLQTPFRLSLPPGKYVFMIQGPGLGEGVQIQMKGTILKGTETHLHSNLPGFDPEPVINRYAQ